MASSTKSKLSARIEDLKVKGKKIKKLMARWLRLVGTRIGEGEAMVAASLIILPKAVERQL